MSHIRDEEEGFRAAMEEAIRIGRAASRPVQISHNYPNDVINAQVVLREMPRADEATRRGEEPSPAARSLAIARHPAAAGELTEVPSRSPPRAPPYWKSQVLRRQALGDEGEREASHLGGGESLASGHEAA